jgi:hypothetical protein
MTTGAAKFHPPSQLTQMFSMGKTDILEDHLSRQVFSSVTSCLQAIPIIHFVMELLDPFSNHEIGHPKLEIDPFSLEMV